ncbi:MAG TPA: POT family MFS transporter [Sedimentisphaerales bacterium]|nr:POT family MFS transporter [Sedimentisphaerales bacterium]
MAESKYLTAPVPSTTMPRSVPYILVNETAERFSFYGMTSILVVFMTHYLMGPGGVLDVMGNVQATKDFHFFNSAVYLMPLIGALISDIWLGKFRTIIFFSIVYCLGFVTLVLDLTRLGLAVGLVLIAVGSGIIKPCVSANVGDQFGKSNTHLLSKVYSWFYFAINLGACVSMWRCPELLDKYGPRVGFGVPAVFMFVATAAYWLGRRKFVHIQAAGIESVKNTLRGEPIRALGRLCILFLFIAMFWSLFYQSQSAWVLQAENMNLRWLWKTWLPAQVQFVNSALIMILIPLFAYVIYPAINRFFPLTALRKISIGLFVAALSFVVPAWLEMQITAGGKPSVGWQFFAYVILTAAEVLVSITCLEFSYTQAPKSTKSFVQALFLLSISLGNAFTAIVNAFIQNEDGTSKLPGASYYWFFTIAMLVTAILFIPVAARYREKSYIQDESSQDQKD